MSDFTWASVVQRWVEVFPTKASWLGAGALALGVVLMLGLTLDGSPARWWKRAALGLAVLGALAAVQLALAQAWLADDAFISFRYARHLAEGHGLVWNLGHRVEGYTNFLWTVLVAVGLKLGVPAQFSSTALTLAMLVAFVVGATALLSREGWVAVTPTVLAVSAPFSEFGTSGLEALPAAVAVAFSALWLRDARLRPWAAWWALGAALLRPDHALFLALLGLVQLRAGKKAVLHTLAAGLTGVAWWCARWAYYGEFFPNTFHAKASGTNWPQGLVFFTDLALTTQVWLALPLVLFVGVLLLVRRQRPTAFGLYATMGAALFTLYVTSVGGDFMEYRFGLTPLALFAVWADDVVGRWVTSRPTGRVLRLVACVALLPLGVSVSLVAPGEKVWHLSRESSFYRVTRFSPLDVASGSFTIAQKLGRLPEAGASAPPVVVGAIGMVGALTRLTIIDPLGLTNPIVARRTVTTHGRPGHEKIATIEELLASGAVWSLDPHYGRLTERTRMMVNGLETWVLRDTKELRAALPGLVPEPAFVLGLATTPQDAREFAWALRELYVQRPEVVREFEAKWALPPAGVTLTRQGELTRAEGACEAGTRFALGPGCAAPREWQCESGRFTVEASCREGVALQVWRPGATLEPSARVEFELAAGVAPLQSVRFDAADELSAPNVTRAGGAFEVLPGSAPRQQPVVGVGGGGLLNGFAHGDEPTGRVTVRLPVEPGKPVWLSARVGGGKDGVWIDLAGERVTGRNDELLRTVARRVVPTGDTLEVTAVDDARGGWGHVLLDEVHLWPAE